MGPKYVLILDFCVGCLNFIRLTDEELRNRRTTMILKIFL